MLDTMGKVSDRLLAAIVPERRATAAECCYEYKCWQTYCNGPSQNPRPVWTEHRRLLCNNGFRGQWKRYYCGSCLGKRTCS